MRREVWFGLSIMAAVVIGVFWLMPSPSQMTNGHLGLLMLALVVVAIMLGFPTAFTLMGMGVIFAWLAYRSQNPDLAIQQTLDLMVQGLSSLLEALGFRSDLVPALPTALMKPLSGSGARGMMVDAMKTYGADSFVGRLASTFQGATDTTFYILALYFGAVGVRKTRNAVALGLLADLAGVVAAIFVAYIFWG